MNDTIAQTVLLPDLCDKPVVATFDQAHASSDGVAVLLKAADARLELIEQMAATVVDGRQPARVTHSLRDLLAQRIFAIACEHPDGDAERFRERLIRSP